MGIPEVITATNLMETMVAEGIMGGVVDMAGMEEVMVGADILDGEAAVTMTDSYFSGIFSFFCTKALAMFKEQNASDTESFALVFQKINTNL